MSEIGRVYPLGSRQARQLQLPERRPEASTPERQVPERGRPERAQPERHAAESRAPERARPEPRGPEPRGPEPRVPEPLWRDVLGRRLRALRADRDETLAQTAERAGISPQYLSEVERGRKEASSEMIAALAGALGVSVAGLMTDTAEDLRRAAITIRLVSPVGGRSGGPAVISRPGQRPAGPVALARAA